jgi:hypothetical protein
LSTCSKDVQNLIQAAPGLPSLPTATIFNAPSERDRCARIQTLYSSAVVRITGIAFGCRLCQRARLRCMARPGAEADVHRDRTVLGRITKRGNRYLRTLFMQGARVILLRPANWAKRSFGPWLTAAANRLHHNVLATALANKLARIAWTVLMQAPSYEARVEPRTA